MTTTPRKPYLTDLTDEQWTILAPLLLPQASRTHVRWTCAKSSTRSYPLTAPAANGTCCRTLCFPRAPSMKTWRRGATMARGSACWTRCAPRSGRSRHLRRRQRQGPPVYEACNRCRRPHRAARAAMREARKSRTPTPHPRRGLEAVGGGLCR